jgi:tyrosine-protein kinase Etk/Wzc
MEESQINYRKLLNKALKHWYLFVIIFPLTISAAYLYLRYTPSIFQSKAMVLIKNEEGSGQISEEAIFAELGLSKGMDNLENEAYILQSTPLMEQTVRNRELQYQYIALGHIKRRDLYGRSPIRVVNWEPAYENAVLNLKLEVDNKGGFEAEVDEKKFSGEFGVELKLPSGAITLSQINQYEAFGPIGVRIVPEWIRAKELTKGLSVEVVGKNSSILALSFRDDSPERARDVLAELISVYNEKSVEVKNSVFENTIDLINERIQLIGEELSDAEQDVEAYKRRFNMLELSSEGSMLMNEVATYNKEISGTRIQMEILNSIEDFLIKNRNSFEFVPSNLSLNNLTLTTQLNSFNQLLVERGRLRNNLGPSHPDLILTEKQIQNLRETIIENIKSIKADLQITWSATQGLKNDLQNRMQSLPRREMELVEIERQKNIKENLYLYLLQKREEAAISLAVTVPKGRTVEPAILPGHPVSPKPIQIILIAVFMGIALPLGILLLIESLNDKIQSEDEIEKVVPVPIVGMLAKGRKNEKLVVKENSRSLMAEMFRLLRANLAYVSPGEEIRSILITSSISGEGKSFISLNLGMTQALTGKKVLILELDLRKPKQETYINMEASQEGIVNYLIDPLVTSDQIIRNTGIHPNLDIITSGPKPPNPSELILSPRLRELVDELKERYDLIILDAPPVGMVADALQMKDLAQATMYVVRMGYSRKAHMQIVANIAEKKKLPRPFIVLNSVKVHQNSNYGYFYGYGYGADYYEEDSGKRGWRNFFTNIFSGRGSNGKKGADNLLNGDISENGKKKVKTKQRSRNL